MTVNIRLGAMVDMKAIQDLNHRLFLHDAGRFNDMNVDWPYQADGIKYFTERLSGHDGALFVAEHEGCLVGYIAGDIVKVPTGYIGKRAEVENIFVVDECRSQGIGKLLMNEFHDWCRQQEVKYVIVEPYYSNERAVGYYKQQGFKPYQLRLLHEL